MCEQLVHNTIKCHSHLPETRRVRLCHVLEEGVVQLLVIYVDLSHLRLHALARLRLERHVGLLLFDRVTHGCNTGVGDVRRELERGFLNTTLALQIVALGAPMCGDRDGVAVALEVEEQPWVGRGNVCPLDDLGLLH